MTPVAKWGYPDWFRILVGFIEVSSALLLLIARGRFVGASLLSIAMAGAVFTHLLAAEYTAVAVPLTLLLITLYLALGLMSSLI